MDISEHTQVILMSHSKNYDNNKNIVQSKSKLVEDLTKYYLLKTRQQREYYQE